MSLSTRLPLDAVELVIGVITRLIIRAFGSSDELAQNLAMQMLVEYQPETVRELRLAAEAICLGMDSLAAMSESGTPDISPAQLAAARRWSCSLSRAGAQTQRRLDELQRARRAGLPEQVETQVETKAKPKPDQTPAAEAAKAKETTSEHPTAPARPPAAPASNPSPAPAATPRAIQGGANPIAEAELAFVSAYQLFEKMRAQFQGAAPDSRAAQQIRAQEQVVRDARQKLEQAQDLYATNAPPHPNRATA